MLSSLEAVWGNGGMGVSAVAGELLHPTPGLRARSWCVDSEPASMQMGGYASEIQKGDMSQRTPARMYLQVRAACASAAGRSEDFGF